MEDLEGAGAAPVLDVGAALPLALPPPPPAPATLFYGTTPNICNPLTAGLFTTNHSAVARTVRRLLSIYGDVLHDETSNVNVDLGGGETFTTELRNFIPVGDRAAADTEITRMTTDSGNPSAYVLERGKTHPWNQTKIVLGVFNNDNLRDLLIMMITLNIRNINVDCAPINLFARGLGDAAQPLNRILYITNLFDAAPNLLAANLHGAIDVPKDESVIIELLPGFFFEFSIIPVGGAGAGAGAGDASPFTNRVRVLSGGATIIDLFCNGPYSLGAINKFLQLPPRRGVVAPRSTIITYVGGTQRNNATEAGFNPLQKFLVICVKEITDWGLAYKNSDLNFLNQAGGKCAIASFDNYFLDMMGEVCGYSIAVGAKTTTLLCYANCLTNVAGFNPYSNIYDHTPIDGRVAAERLRCIANIDTRIGVLSLGNIFGYLEYLDLEYYKHKIDEWYVRYTRLVGIKEAGGAKDIVINSDEFKAEANTLRELTFSNGIIYLGNILAEALDRQYLYNVFFNTIQDYSESTVDKGVYGVGGMIETIDKFIIEKFKGYDDVNFNDRIVLLNKIRAILYSYMRSILSQPILIEIILMKIDIPLKPMYVQACLVHFALDRSGRPDKIGIATFFNNIVPTASARKIDTSTSRGKPSSLGSTADIFAGTYAHNILISAVDTPIDYTPYSVAVFHRRKVVDDNLGEFIRPAINPKKSVAKAIAKAKAEDARISKFSAKASKVRYLKKTAAAAAKRGQIGGGNPPTPSTEIIEISKLADYDEYCYTTEISENAASKINEMLDKYRRGELTGEVYRQNSNVNEFITNTLSKATTFLEVINSILELLVMLEEEAANNKSYYEYLTVIRNLTKLCDTYFSDDEEADEIDTDELISQVLNVLFWEAYTSVVFESCVNSADIAMIIRLIDKVYEMEMAAGEPMGHVLGGRTAAANLPADATPDNIAEYITAKRKALTSVKGNLDAAKPLIANIREASRRGAPEPAPIFASPKVGYGNVKTFANLPQEPPAPKGAQLVTMGASGAPRRTSSGGARRKTRRRRSTPRRITRNKKRAYRRRRTIRLRK